LASALFGFFCAAGVFPENKTADDAVETAGVVHARCWRALPGIAACLTLGGRGLLSGA
jgi:hypothetical protein